MSSGDTILLVEDSRDDIELTRMAFKEANITNPVIVARDGVEALDFLFATGLHTGRDARDLPVVVLLDLKLPKLGGLEVLERIRKTEHTSRLPVVILTSSNEDEDRAKSYDLGANSFVRKPVDFDRFVNAATQLGLYWTLLNQSPPVGYPK